MNYVQILSYLLLMLTRNCISLYSSALLKLSASGHRLNKYVIKELDTTSVLECSQYCLRKLSVCKSINYKRRKGEEFLKNCQLVNATKDKYSQKLLSDEHYDYYEMVWNFKQEETKALENDEKCKKIKSVGQPVVHRQSGVTQGAWIKDPLGYLGSDTVWYINGYHSTQVLRYENMDRFKAGVTFKTYNLPYKIDGTGTVVYGRYLYFNRENTRNIVQYDLVTEKVVREASPNGNIVPRQYRYQWGGNSGIDLSVDENGLWVLYSLSSYSGKLCASQLDPSTLGVLQTFCRVSVESMSTIGNAFVACGVVYSIDNYSANPTTINYAYDTTTNSATNPSISFVNKFGYNSMVTYNPREKVLFSWDNGRQITYPLEFEE